jgi:ABC transporter with metal-binding/Fe-S-binding domain ATP-binding protein
VKGLSLLSGGKDSFLSTVIAMEQGIDVDLSLTVIPEEFSMMYHYPNASWAKLVAVILNTGWRSIQEADLENSLLSLKEEGYTVLVIGAAASDYQKTRMEYLCSKIGMLLYAPLWRVSPISILSEILLRGIGAIMVSVSAEGLDYTDLGMRMDPEFTGHLINVSEKYGINPVGEGGEFETFVTEFSGSEYRIEITRSAKEWSGSYGYLKILDARVVPRSDKADGSISRKS